MTPFNSGISVPVGKICKKGRPGRGHPWRARAGETDGTPGLGAAANGSGPGRCLWGWSQFVESPQTVSSGCVHSLEMIKAARGGGGANGWGRGKWVEVVKRYQLPVVKSLSLGVVTYRTATTVRNTESCLFVAPAFTFGCVVGVGGGPGLGGAGPSNTVMFISILSLTKRIKAKATAVRNVPTLGSCQTFCSNWGLDLLQEG